MNLYSSRFAASLLLLLGALSGAAQEPMLDPVIDWAAPKDPEITLPTAVLEWPPGLAAIWLKALKHDEADVQREAANTFTRAHGLGMPMTPEQTKEVSAALADVLDKPGQQVIVRSAAARALVQLDARQSAELLAKHAARGPLEISQIVEPALARWDYQPQRDIWLDRLAEGARPTLLHLAAEGLAVVGEERAIADLTRLAKSAREPAPTRLAAARALSNIQRSGLEDLAGELAGRSGATAMVDHLVAAQLLAHHSDEATFALLERLADDTEPAVAALAMQRILQLEPPRLIARAERSLQHRNARIRYITLEALATSASPESIARMAPQLDDHVVENRALTRRTLLKWADDEALRDPVIEHTTKVLAQNEWRGDEQAILILTTLDHKPAASRFLELLDHARPEVYVTAAWGLRKLAVPELVEPMFAAAEKLRAQITGDVQSPAPRHTQLAQLLEAMGERRYQRAKEHLRLYVPKTTMEQPRAVAIWSLGLLLEDKVDPELAKQLEQRLADVGSLPPEYPAVRAMSAITLGRMKSESSLTVLRQWFKTETHNTYVGRCCGWAIERITGEKMPDAEAPHFKPGDWFLQPLKKL